MKKRTPGLCTKCRKGYHWSNECHSVRDIQGRIIQHEPSPSEDASKNGCLGPKFQGPKKYGTQAYSERMSQSVGRATEGSAGLDLCSTTQFILMPQMGVQPVPTDFVGPLPKGSVGLILGHSSLTLQGLVFHPGVVDQDYTGDLQVLCSCPQDVFFFHFHWGQNCPIGYSSKFARLFSIYWGASRCRGARFLLN